MSSTRSDHEDFCIAHLKLEEDFVNGRLKVILIDIKWPTKASKQYSLHECEVQVVKVDGYRNPVKNSNGLRWRRKTRFLQPLKCLRWAEGVVIRNLHWNPDRLDLIIRVIKKPFMKNQDQTILLEFNIGTLGDLFRKGYKVADVFYSVSSRKHASQDLFDRVPAFIEGRL